MSCTACKNENVGCVIPRRGSYIRWALSIIKQWLGLALSSTHWTLRYVATLSEQPRNFDMREASGIRFAVAGDSM